MVFLAIGLIDILEKSIESGDPLKMLMIATVFGIVALSIISWTIVDLRRVCGGEVIKINPDAVGSFIGGVVVGGVISGAGVLIAEAVGAYKG